MKPVRLQLSRRKCFDLQALSRSTNGLDAVNVTRRSKWGNPFVVGSEVLSSKGDYLMPPEEAVDLFRFWVTRIDTPAERENIEAFGLCTFDLTDITKELRGKNLACWCKPGSPCHADVLLELANA